MTASIWAQVLALAIAIVNRIPLPKRDKPQLTPEEAQAARLGTAAGEAARQAGLRAGRK